MTRRCALLVFVLGLVASLLCASKLGFAQKSNPVEASSENLAKGQAIYKKNCQVCHGEKGAGDGPAGQRLNPKPHDFTDKASMEKMTDEEMFETITKGDGPMPAFEHKLKETERWTVIHFVRTFSGTGR